MRRSNQDVGLVRFSSALRLIAVIMVLFLIRLVWVQFVDGPELNAQSKDKRSVTKTIPALRGDIVDRNGKVLATTVIAYDINIDPSQVGPFERKANNSIVVVSVEQAATELATLLKLEPAEVLEKTKGTNRYANLAKSVPASVNRKIEALAIPWVWPKQVQKRIYPNGALAGNLLGFMGSDGQPLEGLELAQNKCLAGVEGEATYEQGRDGIIIPQSKQTTVAAKDGGVLRLSIDSDLQYYSQQILTKYVRDERADWGSAVVVEVKTGKVLVAAEAPTVDPNQPGKSKAQDRGARVFQAVFEPGSTLKTVTAAITIDQGKATPETRTIAPYRLWVLNRTEDITDSHTHGDDKLTLAGVLRDSSNTGIVKIGQVIPYKTRYEYWKAFGLGQRTAVNFNGEGSGILHGPKPPDGLTDLVTMFGQGMSVTPIQTAFLYQTIANDGVRLDPQLLMGCEQVDGSVDALEKIGPGVRAISSSTARSTIDMLEKVVEEGGIGRTADVPGYRVAGKSGTAQIKDGAGYGVRPAISFIGMAPADNPRFVLAVTIYKPRTVSNSIGATPPFKAIMQQLLHAYRVPPSNTKSANIATEWK